MRILITGSTGVIGSHLYNELKEDFEVVGLSRNKEADIVFDLCKGEIKEFENILSKNKIDTVIHCAGSINISGIDDFVLNSFVLNKFFFSERGRHIRYIAIGSIAELGGTEEEKNNGESICMPINNYGISKFLQTTLLFYYYKNFNIDIQILRLLNILSPNMPERTFFGKILAEAKKGINGEIIVNSLDIKRDFIDIRDFSTLVKIILNSNRNNKDFIYNIGSGENISYGNLFNIVKDELESRGLFYPKINTSGHREAENNVTYDVSAISTNYNWKPKYKIKDTVKWCLDENKIA